MNINRLYRPFLKVRNLAIVSLSFILAVSCSDFLDIVPDNVSTIDHAFKLRNEAEKYLFTCYSYLPKNGEPGNNIGLMAGDEIWMNYEKSYYYATWYIARGKQSKSSTLMNAWDGYNNYPLFDGIRHCNVFLENVTDKDKIPDLTDNERERWIGEALFLKAYYHFLLVRMYGPIPIVRENLSIDASEEEVSVRREKVDDCFAYIVELLSDAAVKLPELILDRDMELGRITKPIALAVKAQVLLTAASPLFNGNTVYSDFKNHNGEPFFNQVYEQAKWQKAAEAAKEAVASSEKNGHTLYYFTNKTFSLTDTTIVQMGIRQSVCERWNPEVVWGLSNSRAFDIQLRCMVPLTSGQDHRTAEKVLSPPLKIARMFYTKNGVPIEEDKTLDFSNELALRTGTKAERFNNAEGYKTVRLNFDREPRFYASMTFDGGVFYKYDSPTNSDQGTYTVKAKYGDIAGSSHAFYFNVTGYYIKKLVNWNMTLGTSGATYTVYPWPEIRLAEIYLMYAEALNEASGPVDEVFTYLDKVRARAGLEGIKDSWTKYSINPAKYSTKDGLREIIHQERLIELAFEGKRFWDLRRWKKATEYLNQPITGWNVYGTDNESYYQEVTVYNQEFIAPRDYFWPINENELLRNTNLVQNPGW